MERLELQLELEQIRPGQLADLPEEKRRHIIHVLEEQLAELDVPVADESQAFRERFAVEPAGPKVCAG